MKKILVVKSDQVAIQVPGEQTITPKDLLKAINEYESKKGIAKKQVFDLNDVEEMSKEPVKNEEIESILRQMDSFINNNCYVNGKFDEDLKQEICFKIFISLSKNRKNS